MGFVLFFGNFKEFLEMLKKEPATTDQGRDAQTQAAINHHLTNEEIKV